jgi:hypothetical protein
MVRLFTLVFVLLVGCAEKKLVLVLGETWPSICGLETRLGRTQVPPAVWQMFLIRGFNPLTRQLPEKPTDCLGRPIGWEPPRLDTCKDDELPAKELAARALTDADFLSVRLGPRTFLVWTAAKWLDTGETVGPLALAEIGATKTVAKSLGTLRLLPGNARLSLRTVRGQPILVAEGEYCEGEGRSHCQRSMRLLPILRDRIHTASVFSTAGTCLGPAIIPLERERDTTIDPPGISARTKIESSVSFTAEDVRIQELVTVRETTASESSPSPRVLDRAERLRTLKWTGRRFVAYGESLWKTETSAP